MLDIVDAFLTAHFEGSGRHATRVEMNGALEARPSGGVIWLIDIACQERTQFLS